MCVSSAGERGQKGEKGERGDKGEKTGKSSIGADKYLFYIWCELASTLQLE